ncbi:MAG: LytR/AlgR family response regulator transcription factor [Sarcina sp.]
MIDIFLCITAVDERETFSRVVEKTIFIENLDMKITKVTGNPYEILDFIKNRKTPSMYFLNVFLNSDINGIQLGAKIREFDELGVIVYVTQHIELSYLSYIYKVEALDYILKNDENEMEKRVMDCMIRTSKKLGCENSEMKKIKIKQGEIIHSIVKSDIIYFETSEKPHKIVLHRDKDSIEFVGNLKSLEDSLGKEFFRCHKSYFINRSRVAEINIKEKIVIMDNGDICLVSKRFMRDLIYDI